MARQAQREGLTEVAEVLSRIAIEKAYHAAHFAEMNGVIKSTLKENREMMLEGEPWPTKRKKQQQIKLKNAVWKWHMISLKKVPGTKDGMLRS